MLTRACAAPGGCVSVHVPALVVGERDMSDDHELAVNALDHAQPAHEQTPGTPSPSRDGRQPIVKRGPERRSRSGGRRRRLYLVEVTVGACRGKGESRLLGTIRRSDGTPQVTYNGRPLYFYEHEGPGEIKCHNVDLRGCLWWVVTPQGAPADGPP